MIVLSRVKLGLTVIRGCMFAGKTDLLIYIADKLERSKNNVLVFKPAVDTRHNPDIVKSHSGASRRAAVIEKPEEVWEYLENNPEFDAVAFDETQFFDKSILKVVKELLEKGYLVLVAGLNLDFKGDYFGSMKELSAMADYPIPLYPVCDVCGREATRTQRLIHGEPAGRNEPLVVIGADEETEDTGESYQPRCRKHHEVPD